MSRASHVEAVAADYADALGLDRAGLDESGRMTLDFDGMAVTFAFEAEPIETLTLAADLGRIAEDDAAATVLLLERSSYAFIRNLMTIHLADDGCAVRAATWVPATVLTLPRLQELAEAFIAHALDTREALGSVGRAGGGSTPDAPPSSPLIGAIRA
ncbi:MAG: type III secretion system chaperone [Pseudomonadota bacterium]